MLELVSTQRLTDAKNENENKNLAHINHIHVNRIINPAN